MSIPTYCRLCAKVESITIHIFDNVGKRMLLQLKILRNLHMKVTADDPLSKNICILCIGKLDYLNKFLLDCKDAQTFLRRKHHKSYFSMNNEDTVLDNKVIHLENDGSSSFEGGSEDGELPTFIDSTSQFTSPEIAQNNTTADSTENVNQQSCNEVDLDLEMEVVDGDEEIESKYIKGKLGEIECINVNDITPVGIDNELNLDECVEKLEDVFDNCVENHEGDLSIDTNSKCDNMEIGGSSVIDKLSCLPYDSDNDYLDNKSQNELKNNSQDETNHESEVSSVNVCELEHDYDDGNNESDDDVDIDKDEESNKNNNKLDICNPHQSAVVNKSTEESDKNVLLVDPSISELYFRRKDVEDYVDDDTGVLVRVFQCLQNLFDGKCSIMPYFMKWPQSDKLFRVGFKCFCCSNFYFQRLDILKHIFQHLCYSCDLCKEQFRLKSPYVDHMVKSHVLDIRNRKYKCGFCSDIMNGTSDYLKHVNQHCEFRCDLCPFYTEKPKELTVHIKANHSIKKKDCVDCLSTFNDDLQGLTAHILKITKKDGFVCEFCGIGFHSEHFLKLHYEIYGFNHGQILNGDNFGASPSKSQKAREIITFPRNCNKSTFHRKTVKLFRKIVNKEIKCDQVPLIECEVQGQGTVLKFKCPYCPHIINNNEKSIIAHLNIHLLVVCYKCTRLNRSPARLKEHIRSKGCYLSLYKCILCENVSFNRLSEYLTHVTLHTTGKMCDFCSKVFTDKMKKRNHILKVHNDKLEKRYVCDLCGLDFFYEHILKLHVVRKHKNLKMKLICPDCGIETLQHCRHKCSMKEDNDEFICAFCSKRFNSRAAITPHVHTHMNSRMHECSLCKKRFNRLTSLLKHVKDIHSERKWKCIIDGCEKSYTFKSALESHVKKGHKDVINFKK